MPSTTSPSWTFNDKVFTEPGNSFGFIYLVTFDDGTKYLGKKDFYKSVKLPALKSGVQRPDSIRTYKNRDGKRVYFDIVTKQTDWQTYKGSSAAVADKTPVSKEILALASSKRELTYLETKLLFTKEVLESDEYLNENILGKFFKSNLK